MYIQLQNQKIGTLIYKDNCFQIIYYTNENTIYEQSNEITEKDIIIKHNLNFKYFTIIQILHNYLKLKVKYKTFFK